MIRRRLLAALLVSALTLVATAPARATGPSSASNSVTMYSADWCGPCKVLKRQLKAKHIPFEVVDVDAEPDRYERARDASQTNGIPLTGVEVGSNTKWFLGTQADAIARAYRGEDLTRENGSGRRST